MYVTKSLIYETPPVDNYLDVNNYSIKFSRKFEENKIIESNTTFISVVEPENEDKICFDDLFKIYNYDCKGNYSLKRDMYREYCNKFTNSEYMDQAFMSYMVINKVDEISSNELSSLIDDCEWFIGIKPNSSVLDYIIERSLRIMNNMQKSKKSIKDFLDNIQNKYPNTIASEIARNYINKY
jgi:hypothetical protein